MRTLIALLLMTAPACAYDKIAAMVHMEAAWTCKFSTGDEARYELAVKMSRERLVESGMSQAEADATVAEIQAMHVASPSKVEPQLCDDLLKSAENPLIK